MRILFTKISDRKHALELVRDDGSRERLELVSREFLFHDLLHYAVESAIDTREGVWGTLASGKTMEQVNGRPGVSIREYTGTMLAIEQAVGMLTGAIKHDAPAPAVMETIRRYHGSLGDEPPPWLTEEIVTDVRERMRQLQGRWKATPYGQTMELPWPA